MGDIQSPCVLTVCWGSRLLQQSRLPAVFSWPDTLATLPDPIMVRQWRSASSAFKGNMDMYRLVFPISQAPGTQCSSPVIQPPWTLTCYRPLTTLTWAAHAYAVYTLSVALRQLGSPRPLKPWAIHNNLHCLKGRGSLNYEYCSEMSVVWAIVCPHGDLLSAGVLSFC